MPELALAADVELVELQRGPPENVMADSSVGFYVAAADALETSRRALRALSLALLARRGEEVFRDEIDCVVELLRPSAEAAPVF